MDRNTETKMKLTGHAACIFYSYTMMQQPIEFDQVMHFFPVCFRTDRFIYALFEVASSMHWE